MNFLKIYYHILRNILKTTTIKILNILHHLQSNNFTNVTNVTNDRLSNWSNYIWIATILLTQN